MFSPKLPKRITHDQHLEDVTSYLAHFLRTLDGLQEKLGPFVIQLPPSFKLPKHEKALTNFIGELNPRYRYAVEFRHKSWFNPETEKLLESKNICQVWSINQYLTTPAAVTSDMVYLRFVGDRAITEFKGVPERSNRGDADMEKRTSRSRSFSQGPLHFLQQPLRRVRPSIGERVQAPNGARGIRLDEFERSRWAAEHLIRFLKTKTVRRSTVAPCNLPR